MKKLKKIEAFSLKKLIKIKYYIDILVIMIQCPACKEFFPPGDIFTSHRTNCSKNVEMVICDDCKQEYDYNRKQSHMLICKKKRRDELKELKAKSKSHKSSKNDRKTVRKKSSSVKSTEKEIKYNESEYPDDIDPIRKKQILDYIKKNAVTTIHDSKNDKCNYTYEDYSYITKQDWLDILNSGDSCMIELMKLIHRNPEYPKNNCIKIKKKDSPYVYIYNNNEWLKRNSKQFFDDYILRMMSKLEKQYSHFKETEVIKKPIRGFVSFRDKLNDTNNKSFILRLHRKLQDCLQS